MISPAIFAEASQQMATLSDREREVIVLAGKGLADAEIGAALGLTRNTINTYTKQAFRKLKVNGRVEAAVIAAKAGLV